MINKKKDSLIFLYWDEPKYKTKSNKDDKTKSSADRKESSDKEQKGN